MDIFPNQTVIFQWFLFMTAAIALHYGVFRPVLHLLQERRERTTGERIKAAELTRRAEEILAECEKKMAEARIRGIQERAKKLHEAECLSRENLKTVRIELDQKMESLRRDLEKEGREVSLQLRQYSQEIGKEIAAKMLERNL